MSLLLYLYLILLLYIYELKFNLSIYYFYISFVIYYSFFTFPCLNLSRLGLLVIISLSFTQPPIRPCLFFGSDVLNNYYLSSRGDLLRDDFFSFDLVPLVDPFECVSSVLGNFMSRDKCFCLQSTTSSCCMTSFNCNGVSSYIFNLGELLFGVLRTYRFKFYNSD